MICSVSGCSTSSEQPLRKYGDGLTSSAPIVSLVLGWMHW